MQTGEGAARACRGFTYLALLFVIAITTALAAAGAKRWQTAVEREREAEQIQRAREIAVAIARYRDAVAGAPQWPRSLDVLLEDRRSGSVVRHLRRLYPDPVTTRADWELVMDASGAIVALRSRSTRPAWNIVELGPAPAQGWQQRDRLFEAPAIAAPVAASAPAA